MLFVVILFLLLFLLLIARGHINEYYTYAAAPSLPLDARVACPGKRSGHMFAINTYEAAAAAPGRQRSVPGSELRPQEHRHQYVLVL